MGVKGLTGFLKRFAPNSLKTTTLENYKGTTLAIDTTLFLHRFWFSSISHQHKHIAGIYQLISLFEKYHITPIFVFDGSSPLKQKFKEKTKRENLYAKACVDYNIAQSRIIQLNELAEYFCSPGDVDDIELKRILRETILKHHNLLTQAQEIKIPQKRVDSIAGDITKFKEFNERVQLSKKDDQCLATMVDERLEECRMFEKSLALRANRLTRDKIDEAQDFIRRLGYPVVKSDHEGEACCAALTSQGYSAASVSEDTDTCVFGDGLLLRRLSSFPGQTILELNPVKAAEELKFSREQFIDFCILCGTDFCETLKGIGPIRAFQRILKYGSIENFESAEPEVFADQNLKYQEAREVFLHRHVIRNTSMSKEFISNNSIQECLRDYQLCDFSLYHANMDPFKSNSTLAF